MEGQELSFGAGTWTQDSRLEVNLKQGQCNVAVKAGIRGKSGMHVVVRVNLAPKESHLYFARSASGLAATLSTTVSGVEECEIGKLPPRSNGSPRVPKPGCCQHVWSEAAGSGAEMMGGEMKVEEALALEPISTRAFFRCGLDLRVNVTCLVQESNTARIRVEVEGELSLTPKLCRAGREALVSLYQSARAAYVAGEVLRAMQLCEQALAIADTIVPRAKETGDVLNLLGALHLQRKTPTLAVKCLEKALVMRMQFSTSMGDQGIASTLSTLGNAHLALGEHQAAHKCFERALDVLEKAQGVPEPVLATALHSLGGTNRALGRHEEARDCFQKALVLRDACLGTEHPLNAATHNNLGAALQQLNRNREAVGHYQKALSIQWKHYGREHATTAATLNNLGAAHMALKEHQVAVDCHGRALTIQEQTVGNEHADVATTMHNLGNALAAAGRGQDAARCHWRALGIWSRTVGPAHPDIAATLHSLGNVYRGLRQPEAAAKCFSGALRIREATLGPTHTETARTRHCAALVGCALGDRPAAAQELEAALNSLISGLGSRHPWSLQARADLEALRQVTAG